jgi:GNAT superfamily N-acetyltransferase
MSKAYQIAFWPEEVELSLRNDPITTFIVQDPRGRIIGWASHSIQYPGSFGPTGVKKSERGKGLGSLLLKWCLWDLKSKGMKKCQILWVEGDTIYFYLKSVGARICKIYWEMKKKL